MTTSSAHARKALSKIVANRLQKELSEWKTPHLGLNTKSPIISKGIWGWIIEVNGASGTLYSNETYQLQVDFPEHHPMETPQVIFIHPAPSHPHIYSNGHICLGKFWWTSARKLRINALVLEDVLLTLPRRIISEVMLKLGDIGKMPLRTRPLDIEIVMNSSDAS
ncbi:hypothetical protein GIB67_015529 [Kingdonia uniflora]|uniref:UBC core domain-containing protein n=1 Tax=Kingdonia uniflora TaxID=39325 RepID=A0A7J7LAI0_9MAGN|nr:hypothetical protein GIB67_015529 [Kingdonia uniflora]